jgi:DNA polymerase I
MGADATVAGARRVWEWIVENHFTEFSKRDAFNNNRANFDTVDQLQPCLDLLERHYLIRQKITQGEQRRGKGRPSSPVYEVNPNAGKSEQGDDGDDPEPKNPEADPFPQKSHKSQKCPSTIPNPISAISAGGVASEKILLEEPTRKPNTERQTHSDESGYGPLGHKLISSRDGLSDVISAIEDDGGMIGLDCETTGLNPTRDRVRLLQLATVKGTYLIDLFALPDPATDLAELFEAISRSGIIGHNLAFDLPFLMRLGFVPGRVFDGILASRILHAGEINPNNSLEAVAKLNLNIELDKTDQMADWSGSLSEEMLRYAALDAEVVVKLQEPLQLALNSARLQKIGELENKALPCIAWASRHGVEFDRSAWKCLAAEAEAHREQLNEQLNSLYPEDKLTLFGKGSTNWDSQQQVQKAFARIGIPLKSTEDKALAGVSHPLAKAMREYRSISKRATTYGTAWLKHVAPDGRVYPNWNQMGAEVSGRMSSSKPNLQQIPRDPRYRKCFIAPPGRVLVKADYSQIELRIAAKITGEKRMLAAYQNNADIHELTASALLGKPVTDVTKADRQLAKAVNFGLLYGQGARGLVAYALSSYGVSLTLDEATTHRETFFKTYPGLRAWHRQIGSNKEPVETRTLIGRRRLAVQWFTEKANTPVQGTGADGLKCALALLWERRASCPGAFPVLFVHDEIVVECAQDQREPVEYWLRGAMLDGMEPIVAPVPVKVDCSFGPTWGDK